jgi:hypothetical protein
MVMMFSVDDDGNEDNYSNNRIMGDDYNEV